LRLSRLRRQKWIHIKGIDITPHGDTVIRAEDYLVVLTSVKDEPRVRELMAALTES
jgi:Trk K+ transport system NAD-binding subunit